MFLWLISGGLLMVSVVAWWWFARGFGCCLVVFVVAWCLVVVLVFACWFASAFDVLHDGSVVSMTQACIMILVVHPHAPSLQPWIFNALNPTVRPPVFDLVHQVEQKQNMIIPFLLLTAGHGPLPSGKLAPTVIPAHPQPYWSWDVIPTSMHGADKNRT